MTPELSLKEALPKITETLVGTYQTCSRTSHLGYSPLPSREAVEDILADLFDLLFPGFRRRQNLHLGNVSYYVGDVMDSLYDKLQKQISRAFRHDQTTPVQRSSIEVTAAEKTVTFLQQLPRLRCALDEDVQAAIEGDPAAKSYAEIIFCYPGLYAITVYRLAHELRKLGIPLISRMMTEHAHSQTGIDIHPGATIGPSFFIDHGTGVVIGETCDIGAHVKLYQGVTLGALSFPRDADGQIIRGRKRHPTLQDDVVVYANATILGGDTVIGHHAIIGSNVWLTHGVEPYIVVTLEKPSLRFRGQEKEFALNYQI